MTNLKEIFKIMGERYKIFANLDEKCCYTQKIIKYDSNIFICSIRSLSNIDEIIECISEEGSSVITYYIENNINRIRINNIFMTLLINFDFDPFCIDDKIHVVITAKDIFEEGEIGDDDYEVEVDDDYIDHEDENENDDEDYDEDIEDDIDETENLENQVKKVETVENVETEETVENEETVEIEEADNEETEEADNEETVENEETEETVENKEIEETVENEETEEADNEEIVNVEAENDEETVENEETEEADNEEIVNEEAENEETEEYTFDRLNKLIKNDLLQIALKWNIRSYNNRTIKKQNRPELIECLLLYQKNKKK